MLILVFKSMYVILNLLEAILSIDLAAESALSFPLILLWLVIQQKMIFFQFCLFSNFII